MERSLNTTLFLVRIHAFALLKLPLIHRLFLVVVGSEEEEAMSVNVRNRDDVGMKVRAETAPLEQVLKQMLSLKSERRLENKLI